MHATGKWIEGIDVEGSVADAARRSVEARLTAVLHFLPLAAYLAHEDVEHVHRLRVSTRRAVAALRLYGEWLPRKPLRWMKKRLKKVRRAAGDARDLDVLAARLGRDYGERAAPIVALVAKERAAVQPAIVAVADGCRRRDRLARKTAKLLDGIHAADEDRAEGLTFRDWAKERLREAADRFFESFPREDADVAALHQFRIRGKALRYTMELLAAAFGASLRDEHYPVVESLQERLGAIQDHVAAGKRLRQWADEPRNNALQTLLRELAAEEDARLESAIIEFRSWWTAERAEALRTGIISAAGGEAACDGQQDLTIPK